MNIRSEEKYKHGQVLWALWQLFGQQPAAKDQPIPKQFVTRVRRMADLGVPIPTEERPSQAGIDVLYDPFQVFELGLALTLGDNGLNQGVIARFINNQRPKLREEYNEIMDRHDIYQDLNKRYFLALGLAEFSEAHGIVDANGESAGVRHIDYPMTDDDLARELPRKLLGRAVTIVEYGSIARLTARSLRSAPETKRGRRKQ